MNKFKKMQIQLLTMYGNKMECLEPIQDHYYNRLRYLYHQGLPVSFYILFNKIADINDVTKCILFTKILEPTDDYRIVSAQCKYVGNHAYLEVNGKVYDVCLNVIADKDFYEMMFKPRNKKVSNKEDIIDYIDRHHVGDDSIDNAYKVPLTILDEIDRQRKEYDGKHKELIERQVSSYFHDIHYDDGLLFMDINKKGTR